MTDVPPRPPGQPAHLVVKPKDFELYQDEMTRFVAENEHLRRMVALLGQQNAALKKLMMVAHQMDPRPQAITAVLHEIQSVVGYSAPVWRRSWAWRRLVIAYFDSAADYGLSKSEVARRLGVYSAMVHEWKHRLRIKQLRGEKLTELPKVDPRAILNDPQLLDLLLASEVAALDMRDAARRMAWDKRKEARTAAQIKRAKEEGREHRSLGNPSDKMKARSTLRALENVEGSPAEPQTFDRYKVEE